MADENCAELHLLIQADIDGELSARDAAKVAVHVAGCANCARRQARLLGLRDAVRETTPRYQASAALRAQFAAPAPKRNRLPIRTMAAGMALAASVLLLLPLSPLPGPQGALVSAHLRALQPGHLTDVLSTDQHTVKPWFDGRLTFTPLVKDLASDGFPLVGGRLDVVEGHDAAVMVYRRRDHMIDVFTWPTSTSDAVRAAVGIGAKGQRDGYGWIGWQRDGIAYWAVSSVNADELGQFVADWQASSG